MTDEDLPPQFQEQKRPEPVLYEELTAEEIPSAEPAPPEEPARTPEPFLRRS